ncbi:MAG: AMP-binding protein [Candidatus Omnitrophota bacterium]|nr:AMP-binding protein [Candidatus Omnitrophota bacterium]
MDNILFRPWKELKRLQNEKLRYFIRYCLYPFSPYYRRLFDKNKIKPDRIKTVEDLRIIPFVSKDNFLDSIDEDAAASTLAFCLQANEESIKKFLPKTELMKLALLGALKGKDHVKARLEKEYRPIFLTATAGTTNKPISFLYTSHDIENLRVYGKRLLDIIGIKNEKAAVNVFPYAPHLAFWQTVLGGIAANVFILSTGGGKTLGTAGNIHAIQKVRPQFLIGVPNYVYHILKTARAEGLKLDSLNRIILGAGRIPIGFKLKICRLLNDMGASGVRIMGTYGFTEARSAWAECSTEIDVSSGYHTYPDKEIFEIINPATGEVKAEGEDGEIVYSCIDGRGSSVLRYRTGDFVKGGIAYSPCPHCGRTVPRISSDISRASNIKNIQFSKIKGTLVNINDLEHILDGKEEIDEWQIEIGKKDNDPYEVDRLILYVSLLGGIDEETFRLRLNDELLSATDISFNEINFISRKEIQQRIDIECAVKAKKIVDKRPAV